MLSHLADACDECVSILAHLQLQCIDRAIIPMCAPDEAMCAPGDLSRGKGYVERSGMRIGGK